jgi:hypothetical protein
MANGMKHGRLRKEKGDGSGKIRRLGLFCTMVWQSVGVLMVAAVWGLGGVCPLAADAAEEEPPVINPFGARPTDREDAVPGYVETSDGKIYPGLIYMTRDKRLKLYDDGLQRQREIPLRVVQQIDCQVKKEWMEKEWRFKELALDEKMYTGREYPAREYLHTVTLQDGRKITGPLAEIIYVKPYMPKPEPGSKIYQPDVEPMRFILYKRHKGEFGQSLKSLVYVKCIKLGEEALEEGRRKASARPGSAASSAKQVQAAAKSKDTSQEK